MGIVNIDKVAGGLVISMLKEVNVIVPTVVNNFVLPFNNF
jgi:hypothetical protein